MTKPRDHEFSHGQGEKVTMPGLADSPPGGEGELAETLPTEEQVEENNKEADAQGKRG